MFCFYFMIVVILIIVVMGKCFIDRNINVIKKCFKRNNLIFKNVFRCLVFRRCL